MRRLPEAGAGVVPHLYHYSCRGVIPEQARPQTAGDITDDVCPLFEAGFSPEWCLTIYGFSTYKWEVQRGGVGGLCAIFSAKPANNSHTCVLPPLVNETSRGAKRLHYALARSAHARPCRTGRARQGSGLNGQKAKGIDSEANLSLSFSLSLSLSPRRRHEVWVGVSVSLCK